MVVCEEPGTGFSTDGLSSRDGLCGQFMNTFETVLHQKVILSLFEMVKGMQSYLIQCIKDSYATFAI